MLVFYINLFAMLLRAIYVKFVKTTCCIWPEIAYSGTPLFSVEEVTLYRCTRPIIILYHSYQQILFYGTFYLVWERDKYQ
jgi:hypothetical protein